MTKADLTQAEAELFDSHYREGWRLTNRKFFIAGRGSGFPTWLVKRRLKKAAEHFEHALAIDPTSWPSMWALGKIHQRVGNHEQALAWFSRSFMIKPDQPDVAREAGLSALEIGDFQRARVLFEDAIRAAPTDAGLVSNLALAQLLAGCVEDAQKSAAEAVARAPKDQISRAVERVVEKVRAGRARVPKTMAELRRLG